MCMNLNAQLKHTVTGRIRIAMGTHGDALRASLSGGVGSRPHLSISWCTLLSRRSWCTSPSPRVNMHMHIAKRHMHTVPLLHSAQEACLQSAMNRYTCLRALQHLEKLRTDGVGGIRERELPEQELPRHGRVVSPCVDSWPKSHTKKTRPTDSCARPTDSCAIALFALTCTHLQQSKTEASRNLHTGPLSL